MSNISNPKPFKRFDEMESEHNNLNKTYVPPSKHKFEGWPILWILVVILIVSIILWYTGLGSVFMKWLDNNKK